MQVLLQFSLFVLSLSMVLDEKYIINNETYYFNDTLEVYLDEVGEVPEALTRISICTSTNSIPISRKRSAIECFYRCTFVPIGGGQVSTFKDCKANPPKGHVLVQLASEGCLKAYTKESEEYMNKLLASLNTYGNNVSTTTLNAMKNSLYASITGINNSTKTLVSGLSEEIINLLSNAAGVASKTASDNIESLRSTVSSSLDKAKSYSQNILDEIYKYSNTLNNEIDRISLELPINLLTARTLVNKYGFNATKSLNVLIKNINNIRDTSNINLIGIFKSMEDLVTNLKGLYITTQDNLRYIEQGPDITLVLREYHEGNYKEHAFVDPPKYTYNFNNGSLQEVNSGAPNYNYKDLPGSKLVRCYAYGDVASSMYASVKVTVQSACSSSIYYKNQYITKAVRVCEDEVYLSCQGDVMNMYGINSVFDGNVSDLCDGIATKWNKISYDKDGEEIIFVVDDASLINRMSTAKRGYYSSLHSSVTMDKLLDAMSSLSDSEEVSIKMESLYTPAENGFYITHPNLGIKNIHYCEAITSSTSYIGKQLTLTNGLITLSNTWKYGLITTNFLSVGDVIINKLRILTTEELVGKNPINVIPVSYFTSTELWCVDKYSKEPISTNLDGCTSTSYKAPVSYYCSSTNYKHVDVDGIIPTYCTKQSIDLLGPGSSLRTRVSCPGGGFPCTCLSFNMVYGRVKMYRMRARYFGKLIPFPIYNLDGKGVVFGINGSNIIDEQTCMNGQGRSGCNCVTYGMDKTTHLYSNCQDYNLPKVPVNTYFSGKAKTGGLSRLMKYFVMSPPVITPTGLKLTFKLKEGADVQAVYAHHRFMCPAMYMSYAYVNYTNYCMLSLFGVDATINKESYVSSLQMLNGEEVNVSYVGGELCSIVRCLASTHTFVTVNKDNLSFTIATRMPVISAFNYASRPTVKITEEALNYVTTELYKSLDVISIQRQVLNTSTNITSIATYNGSVPNAYINFRAAVANAVSRLDRVNNETIASAINKLDAAYEIKLKWYNGRFKEIQEEVARKFAYIKKVQEDAKKPPKFSIGSINIPSIFNPSRWIDALMFVGMLAGIILCIVTLAMYIGIICISSAKNAIVEKSREIQMDTIGSPSIKTLDSMQILDPTRHSMSYKLDAIKEVELEVQRCGSPPPLPPRD